MSIIWVRSFIEPNLFYNGVPFDNTTPIYQSALEIRVRIRLVALF